MMAELLLVATGVSAWLAVYNLAVFAVRRQPLSLWVGLWSTVSMVYQYARHEQLALPDGVPVDRLWDWLCFASALALVPLIFLAVQELSGASLPRYSRRGAGLGFVGLLALHSVSLLFIGEGEGWYRDWSGQVVRFTNVGPLYVPVLTLLSVGALIPALRMVLRSQSLRRGEKAAWLGATVLYQGLGGNDVMLFSGVTHWAFPSLPGQSLFEFGVVGMAVAFSLRTALRAELSQQQLESQVRQRTLELERALVDARVAANVKAAFLASMSHEVRTPLNGILGLTQLLLDDDLTPRVRDRLELVLRSGTTLKGLVDDVLDFAKLDAHRLKLVSNVFSPSQVLGDVVALYEGTASSRGLRLSVEAQRLPARVEGDEQRLRQVLANLVNNAVKFTNHGGVRVGAQVERLAEQNRCVLRISVVDSGPGISPEDQARLFQPFSQVGVSVDAPGRGGTGLGLAISRELTQLMGGEVSCQSVVGEGSTFSLALPLLVTAWDEPVAVRPPERPNRYRARVLVAEDNPVNRLVADGLLRSLGIEATLVDDGQFAVDALHAGTFELVLMDLQMPRLDGLEATRRLRSEGVSTPIVALTAYASDDDRARCLEAGMTDYLTKPLRKKDLDLLLSRYVARVAA
jgi:signal transduction histidine kinase